MSLVIQSWVFACQTTWQLVKKYMQQVKLRVEDAIQTCLDNKRPKEEQVQVITWTEKTSIQVQQPWLKIVSEETYQD